MKRYIALLAAAVLIITCFAGCNKTDLYYKDVTDTNYTAVKSVDGVVFLVPTEYNKVKEAYSAKDTASLSAEELAKHVYWAGNDTQYQMYKVGDFYLFVTTTSITDIKDKYTELSDAAALFSWLEFNNSDSNSSYSMESNDGTKIAFNGCYFKDTDTNITYNGSVVLLENKNDKKTYIIVVGYGDEDHSAAVKTIADKFLLANAD